MKPPVAFLLAAVLSFAACQPDNSADLVGAWQGLNDQGKLVRVEFSPDGHYRLSVDGAPLTCAPGNSASVKYELIRHKKKWELALFDETDELLLANLRVQFSSENQLELQLLSDSDPAAPQDSLLLKRR